MPVSPAELAAEVEAKLLELANPERASRQQAYLKIDCEFIGIPVPAIRRIIRDALRRHNEMDRESLLALVELLWPRTVFELRLIAIEALRYRSELLESGDLRLVERLIRESKTWALVDPVAIEVAGGLVARFPELWPEVDRWASDDDFWVRRSALLVHLGPLAGGGGNFQHFARYADAMLEEREFFIRKAIGWVLRETAKRRPQLVIDWIAARTDRASGVTMREVTRHLPEATRTRLLSAYRAKVPAD